jgi:hypothetical protein
MQRAQRQTDTQLDLISKQLKEMAVNKETRPFAMPFIYQNASFYQDRLGTNIGKALKKGRVSAGGEQQHDGAAQGVDVRRDEASERMKRSAIISSEPRRLSSVF